MAAQDEAERLRQQLATLDGSLTEARESGGWTAVSKLAELRFKVELRLAEVEAQVEQESEQAEPMPERVEDVMEQIAGWARELPSYLLDDLIATLEGLREVEPLP